MNPEQANQASGAAVGILAGSVIFIALAVAVRCLVVVPDIDGDAGAKRAAMLAKIRATETQSLSSVAWIDHPRGIVRLPIESAMALAVQAGQDPVQARADLLAREKHATAPAPVAPAQPSAFE